MEDIKKLNDNELLEFYNENLRQFKISYKNLKKLEAIESYDIERVENTEICKKYLKLIYKLSEIETELLIREIKYNPNKYL